MTISETIALRVNAIKPIITAYLVSHWTGISSKTAQQWVDRVADTVLALPNPCRASGKGLLLAQTMVELNLTLPPAVRKHTARLVTPLVKTGDDRWDNLAQSALIVAGLVKDEIGVEELRATRPNGYLAFDALTDQELFARWELLNGRADRDWLMAHPEFQSFPDGVLSGDVYSFVCNLAGINVAYMNRGFKLKYGDGGHRSHAITLFLGLAKLFMDFAGEVELAEALRDFKSLSTLQDPDQLRQHLTSPLLIELWDMNMLPDSQLTAEAA